MSKYKRKWKEQEGQTDWLAQDIRHLEQSLADEGSALRELYEGLPKDMPPDAERLIRIMILLYAENHKFPIR